MTKLEFLQLFFNNRWYDQKAAIQSLITIQLDDADSAGSFKKIPGAVFIENGSFNAIIEGNQVSLGGDVEKSFTHMDEVFNFPGDFHPILRGTEITSTFGLMLLNTVLLYEPFATKVEYVNQTFTKKIIENMLARLMVDNPPPGEAVPDDKASVDDCLKFTQNCYFLEGLSPHFVKPGGVDTLVLDPSIMKRKNELMEKHKHELNNPVVFNAIMDELVEMDRKIQMSGPSASFFINDKFISQARRRMFIAFGIEENPTGDGFVALPNSLDQGVDPEKIVHYVNAAISGSYSRSMATGEGGSQVKEVLRLIGRSTVQQEDCNSPVGELKVLNDKEASNWIGGYYIDGNASKPITNDNVKSLIGKPIRLRVPQYCQTPDGNFCKRCLGEGLGKFASRVSAEVVHVPTTFMLGRMKAHRAAGGKNVRLNLKLAIK